MWIWMKVLNKMIVGKRTCWRENHEHRILWSSTLRNAFDLIFFKCIVANWQIETTIIYLYHKVKTVKWYNKHTSRKNPSSSNLSLQISQSCSHWIRNPNYGMDYFHSKSPNTTVKLAVVHVCLIKGINMSKYEEWVINITIAYKSQPLHAVSSVEHQQEGNPFDLVVFQPGHGVSELGHSIDGPFDFSFPQVHSHRGSVSSFDYFSSFPYYFLPVSIHLSIVAMIPDDIGCVRVNTRSCEVGVGHSKVGPSPLCLVHSDTEGLPLLGEWLTVAQYNNR